MRIEDVKGSYCKKCGCVMVVVQTGSNTFIGLCSNPKCFSVVTERNIIVE